MARTYKEKLLESGVGNYAAELLDEPGLHGSSIVTSSFDTELNKTRLNVNIPDITNTVYCSYVPFNLTGSTVETLMAQVSIPDGEMGPNSKLSIDAIWQWNSTANNKTFNIKIGNSGAGAASAIYSRTRTTNQSESVLCTLANRGVVNSQVQSVTGNYFINSNNPLFTNTLDFATSGWNVYVTGILANATDSLILGGVTVSIFNPRK